MSVFHAAVTPCYTPCWIPGMSNTWTNAENTHSPPCVRSVQAPTCIRMKTDRHTHTHIERKVKQHSHKHRDKAESRRQSSPWGVPSSYLHPSFFPHFHPFLSSWVGGWVGRAPWRHLSPSNGVKAWGESPLTPLKKVGIPISWRPTPPPPPPPHKGVIKQHTEREARGRGSRSSLRKWQWKLYIFWPVCWKAAQLLEPLRCAFFLFFFLCCFLSFCLFLSLLSLILALPPWQISMLWYPSFSMSAVMTHVPIHPPLSTLLDAYSKSSRNKHSLLLPIEHFLLNKPSRHSTGWIFGVFKRIPL